MKFARTLSAVTAAACMTVATFTFADPNNTPAQGTAGSNNVNGASHGQPNTSDSAGNALTSVKDPIARQIMLFSSDPATAGDRLFALEAGCGNAWEVAFSKLVASNGSDPKVKELANMVAADHQAAQQKLEPIASKLDVKIPSELSDDKQAKLSLFSKMPPEKLDKIYLSNMKADHLKNVASYSDHVKVIQNPELRAYASETLPKLREHTGAVLKANDDAGMTTDLTFQPTMKMAQ